LSTPRVKDPSRALRADAQRNRERVLDAARECFAEYGSEAQIDQIAARANVGVGTVYRHFPTKDALLGELVRQRFEEFAANARAALDVEDPWEAFAGLLRANADAVARDLAMQQALAQSGIDGRPFAEETGLAATTAQLIDRAQRAGVLRKDIGVGEVPMIMCAVTSTMGRGGHGADWKHLLELLLDGLHV
jgi:AcrR family transcriptional regulator